MKMIFKVASCISLCIIFKFSATSQRTECSTSEQRAENIFLLRWPNRPVSSIPTDAVTALIRTPFEPKVEFRIPIICHVFRRSDGDGAMNISKIPSQLKEMNRQMAEVHLNLFIYHYNYIDDNAFYTADFKTNEEIIIRNYHKDEFLNIYIHPNSGGGNWSFIPKSTNPKHFVIFSGETLSTKPTSWMHEIGHYLGLEHTFGPRGGIIEKANENDCGSTGDNICDTPVDPVGDSTKLEEYYNATTCSYIGGNEPGTGIPYNPDIRNYMSYCANCRIHYTIGQKNRMLETYLKYRHHLWLDSTNIRLYNYQINDASNYDEERHLRLYGDVNGDNLVDIVSFIANKVVVTLGRSGGNYNTYETNLNFTWAQNWRKEKHLRMLGDVDGDGQDDIVAFGERLVYTALGKTDGTFETPQAVLKQFTYEQGWRVLLHKRFLADVNGDNRMDIVGIFKKNIFVSLGKTGGSFEPPINASQYFTYQSNPSSMEVKQIVKDINNDQKDDLLILATNKVYLLKGTTNGTFSTPVISIIENIYPTSFIIPGDINNDGYIDLVHFDSKNVKVYVADKEGYFLTVKTSSGFFTAATGWNELNSKRWLIDFNGDGHKDIVGINQSFCFVAEGNSQGTFLTPIAILKPYNEQISRSLFKYDYNAVDINNDGKEDIFGFTKFGIYYVFGKVL